MRHLHLRACFAIALVAGSLPASSPAAFLTLLSSGTEAVGATVGTTTLASTATFTATAIFDTTTGKPGPSGFAYTITSLNITVAGVGAFAAAPGIDAKVYLEDPSTTGGFFAAGFENGAVTNGYVGTYGGSSNPGFSAAAPSNTLLLNYTNSFSAGYLIALANGAGFFSLGDITPAGISSAILAPSTVPEPSSLAMLGTGVAALALAARRRGDRAGRGPARVGS